MAGSQVATGITIINSLLGYQAVSLTEFTTSAESAIAAGSKVEIGSAFFTFGSEEGITGFSAITTGATAYIELTPSGTAGSQIVEAAWTETAPTWSDSKQGWYHSTGSVIRTIGGAYKEGTSSCERTFLYGRIQNEHVNATLARKVVEIGDWNMDSTANVTVDHGLGASFRNIRHCSALIRNDGDDVYYFLDKGANTGDTTPQGYVANIQSAGTALVRLNSGEFDNASYDSTGYNRGWMFIEYEP